MRPARETRFLERHRNLGAKLGQTLRGLEQHRVSARNRVQNGSQSQGETHVEWGEGEDDPVRLANHEREAAVKGRRDVALHLGAAEREVVRNYESERSCLIFYIDAASRMWPMVYFKARPFSARIGTLKASTHLKVLVGDHVLNGSLLVVNLCEEVLLGGQYVAELVCDRRAVSSDPQSA